MKMTMKLSTKAKADGARSRSARHNSTVLAMLLEDGSLMSMTSSVSAIAKTPSQKASSRALAWLSPIARQPGMLHAGASRNQRREAQDLAIWRFGDLAICDLAI